MHCTDCSQPISQCECSPFGGRAWRSEPTELMTLKERIRLAKEFADQNNQRRDALWPHQRFALTLGELLDAAERGA